MGLIEDHDPADCRDCIFERQDWEVIRGEDLSPDAHDARARLWLRIIEVADQLNGIARLRHTFFVGIAKEHRDSAHPRLSLEQYLHYISGDLRPDEEKWLKVDAPVPPQPRGTTNGNSGGFIAAMSLLVAGALFVASTLTKDREDTI
ncbi:MAG: hypothetical protein J2P21_29665 [Chloracidobacterium sp.]|nr:hypothetical protein [Chloracidobacterium sp.]